MAKALGSFNQHYPCPNFEGDAYTVFTNLPAAGAMRGYGMPQASFADESHADECAKAVGMTPLDYRWKNLMPKPGYVDGFSKNENHTDSFRECLAKGKELFDYDKKREAYAHEIRPHPPGRRRGDILVQHRRLSPSRWRPRPAACS